MHLRFRLLDLLADGRFHSGAELATALGIASTTVWKHVKTLEKLGLDIYAVRGRGYRLASPLERLDAQAIGDMLSAGARERLPRIDVLDEVESTNAWLAARAGDGVSGAVCIAEQQSAGRGRRGRVWASPYGRNLYLSLLWRFPSRALSGLSLAVGVTVAEACESLGVRELGLKWPNDLVSRHGKVGGVLVDLGSDAPETTTAIIGVGLNVDMPPALRAQVDQPVSDLNELNGAPVSRNRLAAAVLERTAAALSRFELQGLAPFRARFSERDASLGRSVTVEQGGRVSRGQARGIDEHGALVLETADGVARILSGDVSLRAQP
jgi:BirA family biotin operon repressor/biotin-[acetyl-CoA-carboxylase] ligase